jgi:hypothetical protein
MAPDQAPRRRLRPGVAEGDTYLLPGEPSPISDPATVRFPVRCPRTLSQSLYQVVVGEAAEFAQAAAFVYFCGPPKLSPTITGSWSDTR